jgi:amino acid transporter
LVRIPQLVHESTVTHPTAFHAIPIRGGPTAGRTVSGVKTKRGSLGTFGGVFTPSILTILGLILFLRVGYVVGSGGAFQALLILALATTISVMTSISLSAIATNRRVRGGGDYYLISRSLGVSFGGGLGLVLFVAQAVSVGFYCVGFAEGAGALLPVEWAIPPQVLAGGAALLLLLLAYLGADLATRFQFVVMVLLIAALFSFFVGALPVVDSSVLSENLRTPSTSPGFWVLFAVFFPAVTGFTQGVSMSGDLADPAKSLPSGTFAAVALSTIVYAGTILVLAATLSGSELAGDPLAMKRLARIPGLIDAGVIAATLSSALASFLGAPRILQALASDRVFVALSPFAPGHGDSNNPRRAVLLTGAIAGATIAAGNLNAIAGLVSMFFLISYGLLNYATYVEATAASPSFRPRFRFFHAWASLAGTILCGLVMVAIDPISGVVAASILAAIYQWIRRTAVPARWRDSRRAYRFRRIREGLKEISAEKAGATDWQPQILAFTYGLERRERVLQFASWMSGNSGIVTAALLIEGPGLSAESQRRCSEAEEELQAEIDEHHLDAYPLAVAGENIRSAMATLVQAWGIGPVRSNTVLVNWLGDGADPDSSAALWYGHMLAGATRLRQNVVVLDTEEDAWRRIEESSEEDRRIDVWWFDDESSRLALLFAHLMGRTDSWAEARLRLLARCSEEDTDRTRRTLERRLDEFRIEAVVETVVSPTADDIARLSADGALTYLPLRIEGMRLEDPFGGDLGALLDRLPLVALVAASEDIRLTEERDPPDAPQAAANGEEERTEDATSPEKPTDSSTT